MTKKNKRDKYEPYESNPGAMKKYWDWRYNAEINARPSVIRPSRHPELDEQRGTQCWVASVANTHSLHVIDNSFYAEELAAAAFQHLEKKGNIARWQTVCGIAISEEKIADYMQALFEVKAKTYQGDKVAARQAMLDALLDGKIVAPDIADDVAQTIEKSLRRAMECADKAR